jgi:hypothetical protein
MAGQKSRPSTALPGTIAVFSLKTRGLAEKFVKKDVDGRDEHGHDDIEEPGARTST